MNLSKIGSKNTYHKCLRELHESNYIYYHPSPSKFLPVKISIARLDIQEEPEARYKQLDLFGGESSGPVRPKIDTAAVPNMGHDSPKIGTDTVSKMGHYIKPNILKTKTVYETPTENFLENGQEKHKCNQRRVPKSVHSSPPPLPPPPQLPEVEEFFGQNNYSVSEAAKFYLYNKGKGWMLTEKLPVSDWKALAQKWMLNPGKTESGKAKQSVIPENSPENLYMAFLAGEKIFRLITADHFTQLKLELNNAIRNDALQERISQLSGSNQYSVNQLLQAYETANPKNEFIIQDQPNLESLAKRIAVIRHFQQLQQSGTKSLSP